MESFIEKNLQLRYYRDGFTDYFWGFFLLLAGLNTLFIRLDKERPLILILAFIPLLIAYLLCRYYITNPRLGYVRFKKPRRQMRVRILILALVAQLLTAAVFFSATYNLVPREVFSKLINPYTEFFFLVVLFSVIAYFMHYYTLYLVGWTAAVAFPVSEILSAYVNTAWMGFAVYFFSGTILVVLGSIRLFQFLRKYPKPSKLSGYEMG